MSQTGQDKTRQIYYIFAHDTVLTDLAPQVAEANRGGSRTIKTMKSAILSLKETCYRNLSGCVRSRAHVHELINDATIVRSRDAQCNIK